MEEDHDHRYPRTASASFSAIPLYYEVWYEAGTTLAFPDQIGVILVELVHASDVTFR